uniref:Uncharacterized protein n=1 Tax=Arundo donax TaxID=35708 RepID=A0A0A8Y7D5_ARUDO
MCSDGLRGKMFSSAWVCSNYLQKQNYPGIIVVNQNKIKVKLLCWHFMGYIPYKQLEENKNKKQTRIQQHKL